MAAYLLDLVILLVLVLVPAFIGGAGGAMLGGLRDPQAMAPMLASIGLVIGLAMLVYLIVTVVLVTRHAQTLGKKIVGIKVARVDGSRAGFWRIFLLRNLVLGILTWLLMVLVLAATGGVVAGLRSGGSIYTNLVSWLVIIIDALFIFGAARRCVHDYIAGTVVIQAR